MPASLSPTALWFELDALVRDSPAATYARGLELFRSQKVLGMAIIPSNGFWQLTGDVQGTQRSPYLVNIEVKLGDRAQLLHWHSHCTCPVGYQCKHSVALMLKAAYQGVRHLQSQSDYISPSPVWVAQQQAQSQGEQARAKERAEAEAEARLLGWLRELEHSLRDTGTKALMDSLSAAVLRKIIVY